MADGLLSAGERGTRVVGLAGPSAGSGATTAVLFTVYAPPGIETAAVQRHLEEIQSYVQLVAPEARTTRLNVYAAS